MGGENRAVDAFDIPHDPELEVVMESMQVHCNFMQEQGAKR